MSADLLKIEGLGKAYREYESEWHRFASWFGVDVKPKDETWVLRAASFTMGRGEAIGIVGQNGAGKSTLLKLITGILKPTEGSVAVNGRVAAILELGMGFNPDMTGRQNVYHAAGLMGFPVSRIDSAIADIAEFAEVGDYFDQSMRTYSSGMQMRVAFSVATAFRPDILIVDEALSVGDAYFQHKCFDRIRRFQEDGTSLLIVSHDRGAVQGLCSRAILLEKGMLAKDGDPEEVMDFYNAIIAEKEKATVRTSRRGDGRVQTISGTGDAVVERIALLDDSGEEVEFIGVGQRASLLVEVRAIAAIPRLVLGYMIKDRLGQVVFGTNTHHTGQAQVDLAAGELLGFKIGFEMNVGPGSYSISTALVSSDTHLQNNYEWRDLALVFNVHNANRSIFIGGCWIPPEIEVCRP